jgi:hypothetical protein
MFKVGFVETFSSTPRFNAVDCAISDKRKLFKQFCLARVFEHPAKSRVLMRIVSTKQVEQAKEARQPISGVSIKHQREIS